MSILYDESMERKYLRRTELSKWDGYTGLWCYDMPDGSKVWEERELNDELQSVTLWSLEPPPERPYKSWHGDFETPHQCVACHREHGASCCGKCQVWVAEMKNPPCGNCIYSHQLSEHHRLLVCTHPDAIRKDPDAGDLVQGIVAVRFDDEKCGHSGRWYEGKQQAGQN